MRVVLIFLAVLFFLALIRLLSSHGGLGEYLALHARLNELTEQIQLKTTENQLLKHEVRDLQSGTLAIETMARQQLGMIGSDEVFIKLLELKPSQVVAPPPNEDELPQVVENPLPINRLD
ncbi:MAG: septum formation initiator family protein [Thiomicrospira sp.]|jgi:cell division protein FtsB|nr:septum formation initiator family protein [Thiomicrospira sp.]